MRYPFLLFALVYNWSVLSAQVILNEAVTSNSVLTDEDGDTPDWFELHNSGDETVDLGGYFLTDKADKPQRWKIDRLTMAPGEYVLIWASDKDRSTAQTYRTVVNWGDEFRYLLPQATVASDWTNPDFDDADWPSGPSGFGYGDGDDRTVLPNGTTTVFVRRTFSLDRPEAVNQLILDLDFDDGFVAYLNGQEIAREKVGGQRPAWNALSSGESEARIIAESRPKRFIVDDLTNLNLGTTNVLAIQVHNSSSQSSDLTLIPFLTARFTSPSNSGGTPPEILALGQAARHTNFKLSAGGESLFLNDPDGQTISRLDIPEMPADYSFGPPRGQTRPGILGTTTPGTENPTQSFEGYLSGEVEFSRPGGLTNSFALELSGATPQTVIRYTLDGSVPTANSPRFTEPLWVEGNTIVRAALFRPGFLPSRTQTSTYILEADHELPIVSLAVNPDDFFDPQTGMYVFGPDASDSAPFFGANFWQPVEKPVSFTFIEPDGSDTYQLDGGIKIFGGWSRANPQRSFSLFARSRYGERDMDHRFFPQRSYDEFQALILRNSGNDWNRTMLRDVVLTSLMAGSDVDYQAHRAVATYLNGEYWGLYNLREKINEHFLASLHDVDPDELDILERNGDIIHGSDGEWVELMDFIRSNDLSDPENYRWVEERIDVANYVQYQAANIFFDNRDWPGNNIKYWKSRGGKWRWILFDTDFGAAFWRPSAVEYNTLDFALDDAGPPWPNPPWSTLLFRSLMDNLEFRNRWINQMADELNSRFRPSATEAHIYEQADRIASEIPRHARRWSGADNWDTDVRIIANFLRDRPESMRRHVRETFNLPASHKLRIRISDSAEGYVAVNSLDIADASWEGYYFEDVPIHVKAIAREGYAFVRWEVGRDDELAELRIDMKEPLALRPVFRVSSTSVRNWTLTGVSAAVVPNPSGAKAALRLNLDGPRHLTVEVFDLTGRRILAIAEERYATGAQTINFGVGNLPGGSYSVRISDRQGRSGTVPWVKR